MRISASRSPRPLPVLVCVRVVCACACVCACVCVYVYIYACMYMYSPRTTVFLDACGQKARPRVTSLPLSLPASLPPSLCHGHATNALWALLMLSATPRLACAVCGIGSEMVLRCLPFRACHVTCTHSHDLYIHTHVPHDLYIHRHDLYIHTHTCGGQGC